MDKENRYQLKDCYSWAFNDEMFEPVEEPNNVYYDKNLECYFIHIDDVTICAKKFGVSKKHPDDEYCETIGDAVAYKRFMEVLKNE